MSNKPTVKDQQILDYISENYTCKICNNILIQCITLPCDHHYCAYCLDMLGGMTRHCPQCSSPIKNVLPNNYIDQEIDDLIHSCSEPIQKAYAVALDSRFQKTLNRSKSKNETRCKNDDPDVHGGSAIPRDLDDILNRIHRKKKDLNSDDSVVKALKSARKSSNPARPSRYIPACTQTPRRRGCGNANFSGTKVQNVDGKSVQTKIPKNVSPQSSTIDINKVNLLFGIYDHVLNVGNEPNKEMAGGDCVRDSNMTLSMSVVDDGMKNFINRSEAELEALIKETEDIVQLDSYIHKWTGKMRDSLSGNVEVDGQQQIGISEESIDKNLHKVDDALFKASSELLQRLRGMQQHRQNSAPPTANNFLGSCIVPPPPPPRSEKLIIEDISDDSEAEEYKKSLEDLEQILEPPQLVQEKQSGPKSARQNTTGKNKPTHQNDSRIAQNSISNPKPNLLDSIEKSGNNYIKGNIDFLMQMRKYKEALLKIQNHEVETAHEIKELLPRRSFPTDENKYVGGKDLHVKNVGCLISTRSPCSAQIKSTSNRKCHTARLPSVTLPPRPMTASFDAPLPSRHSQSHKQIITNNTSSKHSSKRQRVKPLYTAR